MKAHKSFNDLIEEFLGQRIPEGLAAILSMSKLRPDAQDFIMRMLSLMRYAEYSATGFNPHLIRWLSTTVPSILPEAWGGQIPPLTLPGRHKKIDDYVSRLNINSSSEPTVFVDVGCGFPPLTSAETSREFQDWHIYGVDRSFADYVLYDTDGHYACFDDKGIFQYFQAMMNVSGRALYADPVTAKNQFKKLFEDLFPLLHNLDETKSETVEKGGNRLVHNHIKDFEAANLSFIKSDLTRLSLSSVQVVRCMNVLIYFEPGTRKRMLEQAGELLADGGVIIVGTNGFGTQSRYAVYKNGVDGLFMDEFAFGIDNLGDLVLMPFFTICENDPEARLLAEFTRTIRTNKSFWSEFRNRQDELLKQYDICQRKSDGFLHFPEVEMPPRKYMEKAALLWKQMGKEGYLDGAVRVLEHAGYNVWKNSVGDIAIQPSETCWE